MAIDFTPLEDGDEGPVLREKFNRGMSLIGDAVVDVERAEAARDEAEDAASRAAVSETNALSAAGAASGHASNASASATNAHNSYVTAQGQANLAQNAAADADAARAATLAFRNQAEFQAGNADASAQAAADSEAAAADSEAAAATALDQALNVLAQVQAYGNGWTMIPALVSDGERRVFYVTWINGQGTAPDAGYIGETGIVQDVTLATNVRGPGASSSGTVSSVNNVNPDSGGDVSLTIADIPGLESDLASKIVSLNGLLPDAAGNISALQLRQSHNHTVSQLIDASGSGLAVMTGTPAQGRTALEVASAADTPMTRGGITPSVADTWVQPGSFRITDTPTGLEHLGSVSGLLQISAPAYNHSNVNNVTLQRFYPDTPEVPPVGWLGGYWYRLRKGTTAAGVYGPWFHVPVDLSEFGLSLGRANDAVEAKALLDIDESALEVGDIVTSYAYKPRPAYLSLAPSGTYLRSSYPALEKALRLRPWQDVTLPTHSGSIVAFAPGTGITALALTNQGDILRTTNSGTTWAVQTSSVGSAFMYDIAHVGGSSYVAVGSSNRIFSTSNITTWTQRTSQAASTKLFRAVAAGGGVAVAVSIGTSGVVRSASPTSGTYELVAGLASRSCYAVTYGDGLFAVTLSGTSGLIFTSSDGGITWTERLGKGPNSSIVYANGTWFGVRAPGEVLWTTDLDLDWQSVVVSDVGESLTSAIYANDLFMFGSSRGVIYFTSNFVDWFKRDVGGEVVTLFAIGVTTLTMTGFITMRRCVETGYAPTTFTLPTVTTPGITNDNINYIYTGLPVP